MIDGVLECRNEHFWTLAPGIFVGSLCVRVRSDVSEESIRQRVRALFQPWMTHFVVQIDKDTWAGPAPGISAYRV